MAGDDPQTVIRLRPGAVVWREVEGEVVALELDSSMYISANSSGAVLWKLLGAGATREELIGALVDAFGIEAEHAARDVDLFVEQCRQRGLTET